MRRRKRGTSTSSTPVPTIIEPSCHERAHVSNGPVEPDERGPCKACTTDRNPLGRRHGAEELGERAVAEASAEDESEPELCGKPPRIGEALGCCRALA